MLKPATHEDLAEPGGHPTPRSGRIRARGCSPRPRPRRSPPRSSASGSGAGASAAPTDHCACVRAPAPDVRPVPASTRSAPAQNPLPGAGDHQHPVVGALGHLGEDRVELAPHVARHRVHLVGAVEREAHHAVAAVDEQVDATGIRVVDPPSRSAATVAAWVSTRSARRSSAAATSSSSRSRVRGRVRAGALGRVRVSPDRAGSRRRAGRRPPRPAVPGGEAVPLPRLRPRDPARPRPRGGGAPRRARGPPALAHVVLAPRGPAPALEPLERGLDHVDHRRPRRARAITDATSKRSVARLRAGCSAKPSRRQRAEPPLLRSR